MKYYNADNRMLITNNDGALSVIDLEEGDKTPVTFIYSDGHILNLSIHDVHEDIGHIKLDHKVPFDLNGPKIKELTKEEYEDQLK